MNEQEQDERIRALAREYHDPPVPPREKMWAAIRERRVQARVIPITRRPLGGPRTVVWITTLAATLLLGIALDRLVLRPSPRQVATAPAEPSLALQVATTQHLSRLEAFLTGFRIGEADTLFRSQARDLLTSTRLLLDNPAMDPRIQSLLEDLELILVQIVQPGAADRAEEREFITDGLEQRQVLPRLRSYIPAGPPTPGAS